MLSELFRVHRAEKWRRGAPRSYYRDLRHLGREDVPSREGMRARRSRKRGRGEAGDNRVLYRFLVSRMGRPWDRVLAEIRQAIRSPRDWYDVLGTFRRMVTLNACYLGGVPCDARGRPLPETPILGELGLDRSLFVCPRTGLLAQVCSSKPA